MNYPAIIKLCIFSTKARGKNTLKKSLGLNALNFITESQDILNAKNIRFNKIFIEIIW